MMSQPRAGVGSNQYQTRPGVAPTASRASSSRTATAAAALELPTVTKSVVWHVGSLNAADKGSSSLEGSGLSVSECPDDWASIARLGGNPTWRLIPPRNGGKFLSAHDLDESTKTAIAAWGLEHGFVEETVLWEVGWVDCEDEEPRFFLIEDEDEARREYDEENESAWIEPRPGLSPTPKMQERVGRSEPATAFDHLVTVWGEDTRPDLDGVWWEDNYEPEYLSAPRGVIFPSRLARWTSTTD